VQGRTRPYDELYIEWQRTHNPNFKEPAPKKEGNKLALKAVTAQKKRRALADEDGLRFDEDGAREMEELIRATRICGDRVKNVSSALGNGFTLPPSAPAAPKGAPAASAAAAPAPPRPRPAQTPFPSVWRTTTYEQLNMGDLLTKALAARPRPQPQLPARIGMASKPGPVSLVPPPAPQQGVTA
jgi:SAGA-associated factor 73